MSRRIAGIAAAVATMAFFGGAVSADLVRPIALSASADGQIFVLHRYGGLYRVDPAQGRLWRVRESFGAWQPIDMTVADDRGQVQVFVTQHWPVRTDRSLFRLARYDGQTGDRTGDWKGSLPFSTGVAVPASRQTMAYVVAHQENEIFTLDLTKPAATPRRVVRFWHTRGLGALAFDRTEDRLWVADTGRGRVLSVGLDGEPAAEVVGDSSFPVALAVDSSRRRLYILDNARRRILAVDLMADSPRAEAFAELTGVRDPLGLTVDRRGIVWVGDAHTGRLLSFDQEGRFLRWLRLTMPP